MGLHEGRAGRAPPESRSTVSGIASRSVPEVVSVAGVTDDGTDVALDVLVVLDDVSLREGRHVIATAGRAYEPLRITLTHGS